MNQDCRRQSRTAAVSQVPDCLPRKDSPRLENVRQLSLFLSGQDDVIGGSKGSLPWNESSYLAKLHAEASFGGHP